MGSCGSIEAMNKAAAGSQGKDAKQDKKGADAKDIKKGDDPPPIIPVAEFLSNVTCYDVGRLSQHFETVGLTADNMAEKFSTYLQQENKKKLWEGVSSCGNTAMMVDRSLLGMEKGLALETFLNNHGSFQSNKAQQETAAEAALRLKWGHHMSYLLVDANNFQAALALMKNNTLASFSAGGKASHAFTIVTVDNTCHFLQGWIHAYSLSSTVRDPDKKGSADQSLVQPEYGKHFGYQIFPLAHLSKFFMTITQNTDQKESAEERAAAKRKWFWKNIDGYKFHLAVTSL